MSTVSMRKVEAYVLKRDADRTLEALGEAGCFQIEPHRVKVLGHGDDGAHRAGTDSLRAIAPAPPPPSPYQDSLQRLRELRRFFGFEPPELVPPGTRLPGPAEERLLGELAARAAGLEAEFAENESRTQRTREALEEARAFAGLDMPFADLDRLSFLTVRIGRLEPSRVASVLEAVGERAIIIAVSPEAEDRGDLVVAASTRKGRFALDTELNRAGFRPLRFAKDFTGVPPELPSALEEELVRLESERLELDRRRATLREELRLPWTRLAAAFAVAEAVEAAKAGLEASEQVYLIEGWVPQDRLRDLSETLRGATEGRIALRSFSPRELETVRRGLEEPPVLLKSMPYVDSYERLVLSYATPLYGSVDPTPFAAFFFTLLFAIMFGDLGQGLLILLAGVVLQRGLLPGLRGWRKFAPIVMGAGAGSMLMGLLTGEFFANEHWLAPLEQVLTKAILGRAEDRFLELMPQGGVGRILAFFGFTIAVGFIVNSIGIIINIVNKWRRGKLGEAVFSVTGLVGLAFFWWAAGLAVRSVSGGGPAWFDALGLGLPLLLLFFEGPLERLLEGGHGGERESALEGSVKGMVALIETVSYYLSNSLSFLRVGAFALSHAVLSYITFLMGDMVRGSGPFGLVWEILVVLVGNAIILVLEGMIVAIQVVRLQYYEFFSKFMTESGRLFVPFRFEFRKEK